MEMDLNNIIEKIKQEGVGEAEKKASEIVSQAEQRSSEIISAAEKEKETIINKAQQDADRLRQTGKEALRQASRDVLLGLRGAITALFDNVVKEDVAKELSPDVLKEMVAVLVDKFQQDGKVDVEVLLSEKDKETLEKDLFAKLRDKMAKGVTLKASPKVESGFLIGKKGENSYYDFTDEAIAESFKTFLNPKMTVLLNTGRE